MKLDVKAFGLTCGLLWGFGLFFLTWWIILLDGPTPELTFLGRLYRGYRVTPGGSLVGLIWALLDGFVGGVVFAWLYNRLRNEDPGPRRPSDRSGGSPQPPDPVSPPGQSW